MSSGVIITIVVIGAIIWLAVLGVSALRSRGSEEIPSNLAPGITSLAPAMGQEYAKPQLLA